ncbi:DUF6415 family natural product biosynthesis protein [Streptomyces coelicoflavus]|uniref:DUF6415 family natural product biosynthesis protein n=1 Tax=Streptomyces TaxID=1883 RepID=UPI0012923B40|nr:DUF6415 family natural product biosynthesis protein [Streptomyces sp. SYP-A7193]QFX86848.1 hypothetical protein GEV49_39130 [Streptomyces sp. SYP-A7193]
MTSVALPRRDASTDAPRWAHPVEPARLPARAKVEAALAAVRAWRPYDGDTWLDDVADVLDAVPPAEDLVDELAQRLRGYLMQLVGYALTSEVEKQDERATWLIARAREVREEELPGDYRKSVVHLRRMGWAVNELHDLLAELEAVKGPESLQEVGTP